MERSEKQIRRRKKESRGKSEGGRTRKQPIRKNKKKRRGGINMIENRKQEQGT